MLVVTFSTAWAIVRRSLASSRFSPYPVSFFTWFNSNSDVNMQLVHTLEFFELFFNRLQSCATKFYVISTIYIQVL